MSSPFDMLETSCTRLVRRMVNLPRAISRAVDQGLDTMIVGGGRRNHHQYPLPFVPLYHNHHYHPPPDQSLPDNLQSNWDFLARFEQQFGLTHPVFYMCRFMDVLKMAQDEHKLAFLYLHSLDHPFTPPFCKDTLCSEVVVEFLDANFMSWGGDADKGEGFHLATTVQPTAFPFCAIVARGSDDSLVVVQKMEGLVTPQELVERLQTTLEEQGMAFDNGRAKDEEIRRSNIRLRQEQDAAYSASLQADQLVLNKHSFLPPTLFNTLLICLRKKRRDPKRNLNMRKIKRSQILMLSRFVLQVSNRPLLVSLIGGLLLMSIFLQILIRSPNGERKTRVFSRKDKMEAVFKFVDSLGLPGVDKNYRLVSSFPRKVYGVDQMTMSLKDAGFDPETTLFIELV
ncbi:hypothetical protein SSX86_007859 [Deinandra increscens subsp. villosa]|uniref:UBX domain-containing protein n=1 Tax=Deinandra increscens subsp. villosa TaxID=3103831 RepID=A0AAP0DI52_9ASTR